MNPIEEYTNRYGLSCPLFKRPDNKCTLILKNTSTEPKKISWNIFQINTHKESHVPKSFNFTWLIPSYASSLSSNGQQWSSLPIVEKVEWNTYDECLCKVIKDNYKHLSPVCNLLEAKMATWEIFLYMFDRFLANLGRSIRIAILQSIDLDLPLSKRFEAQQKSCTYIQRHSQIASQWNTMLYLYDPKHYAKWLGNIFQKMQDDHQFTMSGFID